MAGLIEIVKKLLAKHVLCDHCLGRQFAALGTGIENGLRGMVLRDAAFLEAHGVIKEKGDLPLDVDFIANKAFVMSQATQGHHLGIKLAKLLNIVLPTSVPDVAGDPDAKIPWEHAACELCGGVFSRHLLDTAVQLARDQAATIEFSTFVVGSRFSTSVMEMEEDMRVENGLKWGELIKSHFNRFVGAVISKVLDKPVDFKAPDVVLLYSIEHKDSIGLEMQIHPYFMYGKYRKLVRGIPQTHWPHRPCRGDGCEDCNFTGKQYQESVEGLITKPFLDFTGGTSLRFHGAGREDIDARMLGEGRPFAVEILNGRKRRVDHAALEAAVNVAAQGKVEIAGLRPSTNEEMQSLKEDAPDTRKRYKALCSMEKPIEDTLLEAIRAKIEGATLHQQTPTRVVHRRADKVRLKHVLHMTWERVASPIEIIFYFETEGGTYIKELISSDEGRTKPSISELAGQKIVCKELDVLEVKK
jgi:tRNA pseudouridine synthase 10